MIIPELPFLSRNSTKEQISKALEANCLNNDIAISIRVGFGYKPEVYFKIAHNGKSIFIHFFVKESCIRAIYTEDNKPVWTDSCVDFFISSVEDGTYYNFEFNCIGTALVEYGTEKNNRELAPIETLRSIIRHPSLGVSEIELKSGHFEWNLIVVISVEAFFKHNISNLSGRKMKANFYKCGNELKIPHFLAWSEINAKNANFHSPEFFKEIVFQ